MHGGTRLSASGRTTASLQSPRRRRASRRLHRAADYNQSLRQQIPYSGIQTATLDRSLAEIRLQVVRLRA